MANSEQGDDIGHGEGSSSRRDALKKAAIGAGIAGAAWVAPSVRGLSIVPDYASAGTSAAGPITFTLAGNGPATVGANNFMNAGPSPQYAITQNGPSDNQAIVLTAPLGPAGNAVYTFPAGQDTDGPALSGGTVQFNIDPPFNKCRVTGSVVDWEGDTNLSDRGTVPNPIGANNPGSPATPNAPANTGGTNPFTVPINILDGPSHAPGNDFFSPVVKIQSITVTIQCF